jgi:hypothetical protein
MPNSSVSASLKADWRRETFSIGSMMATQLTTAGNNIKAKR